MTSLGRRARAQGTLEGPGAGSWGTIALLGVLMVTIGCLGACGSTPLAAPSGPDGAVTLDGGAGTDGGGTSDGGALPDGGASSDGGGADGGPVADGGAGTDGGPGPDGGGVDGGQAADGGVTADGGAVSDGGPTLPRDPAPVKAYSEGECPTFAAGANQFRSAGRDREALVYLPEHPTGAGLLFLWHGLGDSASNFASAFQASANATARNLVIVVPSPVLTPIPFSPPTWGFVGDGSADYTLFDDLLSCLDGQLDVENHRVYTMGFSAGGLWSTALLMHRADYLAAATVFSGGASENGNTGPTYVTPAYPLPALLVHGGTNDIFGGIVHFDVMTAYLAERLEADGHFRVVCDHGGGHTVPASGLIWGYEFLVAHTFGDGTSPYASGGAGDRTAFPEYCVFP